MKYTNNFDFPDAIVQAVENDDYTKGKADYSTTGLIKPPQEARLFALHADEIVTDVADEIWKLFGKAVHAILEQGHGVSDKSLIKFKDEQLRLIRSSINMAGVVNASDRDYIAEITEFLDREPPKDNSDVLKEERMYANIAGIVISGQPDWMALEKRKIEDYKVTGTWKYIHGDFSDYEKQLNTYNYLAMINGYPIDTLEIIGIFKDWKKYETVRANYPPHPVAKIPIEMWSPFKTLQYLMERIQLHEQAKGINSAEELAKVLPCTSEERWKSASTFALEKEGAKRAYKVFDTREEAITALSQKPEYNLVERKGSCKKCEEYCNVSQWCQQFNPTKIHLENSGTPVVPVTAPAFDVAGLMETVTVSESIKKEASHIDMDSELKPDENAFEELKKANTTDMNTNQLINHFDKVTTAAREVTAAKYEEVPLNKETLKPETPKTDKQPTSLDFDDLLGSVDL